VANRLAVITAGMAKITIKDITSTSYSLNHFSIF
jgi:hypothetical protein